jgi:hypothetical protein
MKYAMKLLMVLTVSMPLFAQAAHADDAQEKAECLRKFDKYSPQLSKGAKNGGDLTEGDLEIAGKIGDKCLTLIFTQVIAPAEMDMFSGGGDDEDSTPKKSQSDQQAKKTSAPSTTLPEIVISATRANSALP